MFNNTGIVNVEAGTLELSGGLTNNGELQISGGALDVTTAISGSGSVLFSGAGTFALANRTGFSESIGGFGTTNTLDLGGFNSTSGDTFTTSTSYNGTDTTLTITDTTKGTSASVTLVGNYTSAVLASQNLLLSVAIDGSGGADVTELAPTVDNWNQTTGNWATVADWGTGLPGAANEAVLGGSTSYTVTSSGTVTVFGLTSTPTATLDITGGTFTVTDYAGQGPLMLSGGTLGIGSSSATTASLMQTGGTLTGTGTLTVTGTASLGSAGGYVLENGSGTTDLQGTSTLNGSTSGFYLALDGGRVLQNDGTFKWMGGPIDMGTNPFGTIVGGSTINNSLGATFNDAVASSIVNDTGTNVFNNAGTFETTFASGTTTIGVMFNNTGTVNAESGTLVLSGGGTETGTFAVSTGATIDFESAITLNGTSSTGLGQIQLVSNTLTVNTSASFGSAFTQSGGTLTGTGTVTVTGSASLGSAGGYVLENGSGTTDLQGTSTLNGSTSGFYLALDGGRVLQNDGTFNWMGGPIDMGTNPFGAIVGGSTINNSLGATFNDAVASSIVNNTGTNVFNNAGTFETTFASGTTTIGVTFNNTGTVDVGSGGTLKLSNGGASTGGSFTGAGTLQFSNGYTFDSNSTVSSANVLFSGGTNSLAGTYDATNTTLSGGTLTAGANPITLATNFTQSGGTLTGTGTVTVTGTASLGSAGGYVLENGSGTTDLQGTSTLNGSTSGFYLALDGGRVLQNDGTFKWMGGPIDMGTNPFGTIVGGSTINNSLGATFNDAVASSIVNDTGTNVFNNAGTFETTFASGTTTIGVMFNNTGTVNAESGTLVLSGGGTETGTFAVSTGATIDFESAITLNGTSSTGLGQIQLVSNTLTVNTSASFGSAFTQSGGTLTGTGTVTVTGSASLGSAGGYVLENGSGTTDLQGTSTLNGSTSGFYLALDGGRVLQNDGTFNWMGGPIDMGTNPFGAIVGGSTINNSLGATFNDAVASSIVNNTGTNVFNNAGTFETTFASGTTTIGVTFNNTGTVDVGSGGTLKLSNGGASTGGSFTGAGTLQFSNGYTFDSNSTVSSANVLFSGGTNSLAGTYDATNTTLSGGTLTAGANPITLATNFTQSGGTLTGTGTVTVTGTASLGSAGGYVLENGSGTTDLQGTSTLNGSTSGFYLALDGGRVLQNDGTFKWMGGPIDMGTNPFGTIVGGSTINNSLGATFNDAVASSIVNDTGTNVFNNAGTFETTFASGTTTIGVMFNNTGTVNAESGTLVLSGGGTETGTFAVSTGATIDFESAITLNGTSSTGLGQIQLVSNTLTVNTSASFGSAFTQSGGTLTGTGTVTVTGSASLGSAGGYVLENGSGTTDLQGTSTLNGSTSGFYLALDGGRVLQNDGTFNWMGGPIDMGTNPFGAIVGGSTINNSLGATFNDAVASSIVNNTGTNVFNNAGTFETTFASGTTTIGVTFNNTGIVNVGTGDTLDAAATINNYGTVVGSISVLPGVIVYNNSGATWTGSALTVNGQIIDGGALNVTGAVTGTGTLSIETGATLSFGNSVGAGLTVNYAGASTVQTSNSAGLAAAIRNFSSGDVLNLSDFAYNGASATWTQNGASGTLAINNGTQPTVDITLDGTYSQSNFALTAASSSANAGTDVLFTNSGSSNAGPVLWGELPAQQSTPGVHIFGGNMQVDRSANVVAVLFANNVPPPNYDPVNDPAGPYSITRDVLSVDPFLLPILAGTQVVVPSTLTTLPARSSLIVPNISTGPEGIVEYVTQNSGNNVIDQIIATPNPGQNDLTIGAATQIESGANTAATIYGIDSSFRQDGTGSTLSTYSLAWDQYNSTTYSIDFQIFNPDTTTSSPVETPISFTAFNGANVSATPGTNSATNLPEWEFRSGGGIYALAVAASSGGKDVINFVGYNLNGTQNTTNSADLESFTINPDLSHYTNATNQITQDVIPSLSTSPGGPSHQLEFLQASANNANDWLVAWNETVVNATNGSFLGDQVEFVIDKPGTGLINIGSTTHFTVQLADAQDVHLTTYSVGTNDFVVLAYGDATATHLVDFEISNSGATVTEVGSITDPTTQPYSDITSLGDGRIAVEYDNVLDSSQTSQYETKIFDFRTSGLSDPTLSTTQANYVAGTQFGDTVTGATGVNNLYYYVGEDAAYGTGSSNTFTGGSGGWNIAIFPDARSDYSLTTNASNVTTIASNGNDPAHLGSLAVSNVQILAFDPVADPTPLNGTIDVSGGTYVILGNYTGAVTIEGGSTAEFDVSASGATSYTGSVKFEAATGTAQFDQPADFNGTVSGSGPGGMLTSGDVLQLIGYDSSTTATPGTFNGTTTPLTVTDPGHTPLSLTLTGNYSSSTFTVTPVSGGVDIVDPPATTAAIANSATLDINAPSSETVTFNGGTGSLVLDQPSTFDGQISGFTGTASDPTHSDTIDLVGINYDSAHFSETYNTSSGVLTVSDGSTTTSLTFDNFNATFDFASDGNGGTLIYDPPVAESKVDTSNRVVADGSHQVPPMAADQGTFGGVHDIAPPVTDAVGSASRLLFAASTNNDHGLSLASGQNGLSTTASFLGNDQAIDPSGTFQNVSATDTPAFGADHVIVPEVVAPAIGGDQAIVPSGLGADQAIVAPVPDAAGNAASFAASTHNDPGLSLTSDQNGLSTTASFLGNDQAIDLSGTVQNVSATDPAAFGADHVIVPAVIAPAIGGDQVIVPALNTSGLGDHAIALPVTPTGSPLNAFVPGADQAIVAPETDAAGTASFAASAHNDPGLSLTSDQNGLSTTASFLGNDQAIDLSGTVQNVSATDPAAFGADHVIVPAVIAPAIGGDQVIVPAVNTLGADQAIVAPASDAAGSASSFVASTNNDHGLSLAGEQNGLSTPASFLGNDQATGSPSHAPTLASAMFGGLGNDSFVFQTNLGTETNQKSDAHPNEFGHSNGQTVPQTPVPDAHGSPTEIMFDLAHYDVADLTKTAMDQFHQLVASANHLH